MTSDHIWPPTAFVYTKNRDRILNKELIATFLELLLAAPEVMPARVNYVGPAYLIVAKHEATAEFGALLERWHPPAGLGLPHVPGEDRRKGRSATTSARRC